MKANLKDNKKILLYILPIALVLLLAVVISVLKKQDTELPSKNESAEAFIPDSEEETKHETKIAAYQKEQSEHRKQEQEKQLSQVKNSDFFKKLNNDEEQEIEEEIKINDTETPEEFYERTIMQDSKPTTKEKTVSSPKITTKATSSPLLSEKKPKKEDDHVKNLYNEAIGKKTEPEPKTEEVSITAVNNQVPPVDSKRRRTRSNNNGSSESNFVRACVHGDQEISSGATVRMRLTESIQLEGATIPANTIFYGVANIQSERLNIKISSIKYDNSIKNLSYQVYDNDAIQGLNLPDNIKAELRKKGTSSAINNIEAPNVASGTIIGSTVSSTVDVAKQVLKKSEQEIRVNLKANYNIFLK